MLIYIAFAFYILALLTFIFFLGINTVRIGCTIQSNPRSITMLLPLLINFLIANSLFYAIPPLYTTVIVCALCYFLVRKLENVRIFGLTGGTATGKSTLLKLIGRNLKQLHIIDCEKVYDQQIKKDKAAYKLALQLFKSEREQFLDLETEQIQKSKLADVLYENKQKRDKFYCQIQSVTFWEVLKSIVKNIFGKRNLMLIHAPFLCYFKWLKWVCYPNIVLGCDPGLQIERARKKWSCNQKEAKARIQAQMPLTECKKTCQIYVDNSESQDIFLSSFLTKINPYLSKNKNHFPKPDLK